MRIVALFGLSLMVAGCGPLLGPETARVVGAIEHYGDQAIVNIPAEVGVGEPFTVSFHTYGGGCVSKGQTEVLLHGARATVTPYDVRALRAVCPSDIALLEHTALLRFETAGTAEVVVQGLRKPGNELVSIERTVVVR
jgi:hypothetical protein